MAFFGDSVVRQLFLKTIGLLRGFNVSVDRVFHTNALYVRNTTHDALHVFTDDAGAYDGSSICSADLSISFEWGPSHSLHLSNRTESNAVPVEALSGSDFAVGGIILWREHDTHTALYDEDLLALQHVLDSGTKLIWIATPLFLSLIHI